MEKIKLLERVRKTEGAMCRNNSTVFGPERLKVGQKVFVRSRGVGRDWEVVLAEDRRILVRCRSRRCSGKAGA